MSDDSQALFERLGGASSLKAILDDFYLRVLKDAELAPFFAEVSLERLRNMQFHFMASAFGGPVEYSGAELTAIHAHRGIKSTHFAKFCSLFADVLEDHSVGQREVDDVLGRLAIYKDRITGDATVDG